MVQCSPHMTRTLTSEASQYIVDAGAHPDVPATVHGVESDNSEVRIELTVEFQAAHSICCAQLECYMPFLRPTGLADIADRYREARGLLLPPHLVVTVTTRHQPGFEYQEKCLGAPEDAVVVYRGSS